MANEKWEQVKEIFYAALRHAPEEREQFLNESCKGDDDLRREVESLLSSSLAAGSFMQNPAVGEVAEAIDGDTERLRANQMLGHYKIISLLGTGGMGEVFLAEDTRLHRQVALKVLPENIAADKERLHRFEQEANAASALNHPNILTVHEFGFETGVHFLATEFVDGETLREKINQAELSLTDSLKITEQTAFALLTAHASGIVHRDIKPENVMIRRDGIVKVLDFGLAKLLEPRPVGVAGGLSPINLAAGVKPSANADGSDKSEAKARALVKTKPGVVMGTASYMSPEQARGKETDARTDTFSLGIVLYEMLTGNLPFPGETMNDSIAAILTKEPPPLAGYISNVPAELQRIVRKALTKARDERYQTARDLMIDLKTLRRDLDLHGEIERSTAPDKNREQITGKDSDPQTQIAKDKPTDSTVAVLTNGKDYIHSTSSAEYLVTEIKRHKRGFIGVLSILLVAAIGLGYWFFANRSAVAMQIESIAVMPFVNENGNADNEYLSDGMTESLISSLSRLPKLSVKARSSVFRYKGKDVSPQTIGNELSVQAVLLGRVIQRGELLTLSLELVDARTENVIWSSNYNRKQTDLVSLQSEIARDVANNLRTRLSGAEQQKLAKNYTASTEAYELYLKGRYHAFKLTRQELQKSVSCFQQAIAIDPSYALAYVGLADAYRSLALAGDMPPAEVFPNARAAAVKAIEIDDTLAEAHSSLGNIINRYDWDLNAAETQYKRALELDPNSADAHVNYAGLLSNVGRHAEAIAEITRAREIDPLNSRTRTMEAGTLIQAGQTDEALARLQKTFELDPNFWLAHLFASRAYIQKRMYAEAIAEARKARELSDNGHPSALLAYALARSGKQTEARGLLEELLKLSSERYFPSYNIAVVYDGLDERDKTFAWLERAFKDRDARMLTLKVDPIWNNLRSDPRFRDLIRRVGFSP